MRNKLFPALTGAMIGLGALPAVAGCEVTLSANVQPIFNTNCVACHQDAAPGGGLSLQSRSAIAFLVNIPSEALPEMPRVTPGDPLMSMLFLKLTGQHGTVGASGDSMPIGTRLSDEELAVIENWIGACEAAG